MSVDLDQVIDRNNTDSIKYDFMSMMNPKANALTLPLWVADMDFACPQPVLNAIKDRVDRQILGYTSHSTGEYFRAIGNWMKRRFDWYVHSADIFSSPGVVPAIKTLVRALTEKGDGIIIQQPVYYPFMSSVKDNGRVIVNNRLIETDGYYTIDFADLEQKAKDPANKMMIFCSPHNPVGRVWTEAELKRVGQICLEHDVILISDEIHFDLIRQDIKHIPIDRLFPGEDFIVTCTAPSKTFNLAGMHTSNIIIKRDEFKQKWSHEVSSTMLGPLSIVALEAAYDESEAWLDQVNAYVDDNLDFIGEFVKQHIPRARYLKPEGTYLAWLDLRAYETDYQKLADLMVEDARILLDDGHVFGEEGDGFERINAACPRSVLTQCLERMATALNHVFVGDPIRNFQFNTPWQTGLDYAAAVQGKKNYLVFLRYHGCSLCQLDLARFIQRAHEFTELGAVLSVVLQSDPALMRNQLTADQAPLTIICDPDQEIYHQYQIRGAFDASEMMGSKTLAKIRESRVSGYVHGAYEGNELQLPAVLLFDENGRAESVHYGKEAGDIPSIDDLLSRLGGSRK